MGGLSLLLCATSDSKGEPLASCGGGARDHLEFQRPVPWVVNVWASFGGMVEGFEGGFRASIADAAVGLVDVTATSDGIRATFELEGLRRDEVEASAQAIGKNALRAGAASVRNPSPGPHGWNLNVGVEPAPPRS